MSFIVTFHVIACEPVHYPSGYGQVLCRELEYVPTKLIITIA